MIANDEQFHQAFEQLSRMYRALAALKHEVFPVNEQWFALMAEGPLDEIRQLEAAIGAYTGKNDAEFVSNAMDVCAKEQVEFETPTSDIRER